MIDSTRHTGGFEIATHQTLDQRLDGKVAYQFRSMEYKNNQQYFKETLFAEIVLVISKSKQYTIPMKMYFFQKLCDIIMKGTMEHNDVPITFEEEYRSLLIAIIDARKKKRKGKGNKHDLDGIFTIYLKVVPSLPSPLPSPKKQSPIL